MKLLSSKAPVQMIKRIPKGASKVHFEPFDIPEIEEFRPLNNTRKVHYPMMLEKYQVFKYDESNYDDFRHAIRDIVKTKDNDNLFSENLTKKSGRATSKVSNYETEGHPQKKLINSVHLDVIVDRTNP
jgi:hypothetical protein